MSEFSKIVPPLWRHQQEAIDRAAKSTHLYIGFDTGCGKTRTVIEILKANFSRAGGIQKTLIICPPVLIRGWKQEFLKYSDIDQRNILLLTGSGKKRLKDFKDAIVRNPNIIAIVNYEGLLMKPLFKELYAWTPNTLILDEAQKAKDHKTSRTKLATSLASIAVYKYLLSGSPVINSPMDLFSQFRILNDGDSFGKNVDIFRARYFYDANKGMPAQRYFPNYKIRPGALAELNKIISKEMVQVKKTDCLDLPPFTQKTLYVGMTKEQERLYREMKQDLITTMNDKAVVATMALTKALRLLQIASGFVKTVDGKELTIEKTPKMIALKDLLEELTPEHKIICWAVWKHNYIEVRRVCEELGVKLVEVTGENSASSKQDAVEAFNNDPSVRVMLGHPNSGGCGLNLQSSDISVFLSRTFSLEHSIQAEARNYRAGSEVHKSITRIDLVTQDTIEEQVMIALANKESISDKILSKLPALLKEDLCQ